MPAVSLAAMALRADDVTLDEFAAELNTRMTDAERPQGAVRLHDEHIKRGK